MGEAEMKKRSLGRLRRQGDRIQEIFEKYILQIVEQSFTNIAHTWARAIQASGADLTAALPIENVDLAELAALWAFELDDNLMPILEESYLQAIEANQQIWKLPIQEPTRQQMVAQYLADERNLLVPIGDELKQAAATTLSEGIQAGKGYDAIRDDLVRAFNNEGVELGKPRAERIARTEANRAWNRGSQDAALGMENGPKFKIWMATVDARTRDDHYAADGQSVRLLAPFIVGGSAMMHPGDPLAPASQTVNCRCTTVYSMSANPLNSSGRQYLSDGFISGIDRYFAGRGVGRRVASALHQESTVEELAAAAKGTFTGAIVALIPTEEDAQRLALPEYEPSDSLHITLAWMGDIEDPDKPKPVLSFEDSVALVRSIAPDEPIVADVFAYAKFNPASDDKEPACVLLLQSEALADIHSGIAEEELDQSSFPVWFPHITLGYNVPSEIEEQTYKLMGPVAFDRLRVSYGSEQYEEIWLSPKQEATMATTQADLVPAEDLAEEITEEAPASEPLDPEDYLIKFPTARIRAATLVDIPAFPEARIAFTGESDENGMRPWAGPIALVGLPTGDGRQFEELTWMDPPLTLRWVPSDEGYHNGAVVVGRIDALALEGSQVMGTGIIDTTLPQGVMIEALIDKQMAGGISVDVDDIPPMEWAARAERLSLTLAEAAVLIAKAQGAIQLRVPDPVDLAASNYRLGIKAFQMDPQAKDALCEKYGPVEDFFDNCLADINEDVDDPDALCAWLKHECTGLWPGEESDSENAEFAVDSQLAVVGEQDLPLADRDVEWDGGAAGSRVLEWATGDDGSVDASKLAQAFLWRDDDSDPATLGAYKLGFADVFEGSLKIVPRGVFATAGGRGVDATDIPAEGKANVKSRICSLYARLADEFDDESIICPFQDVEASAHLEASAFAAIKQYSFQPEWFEEPKDLPTDKGAVFVDGGRVYGWVARRGVKHEVLGVTPPLDGVDLTTFLRHELKLEDGSTVPVGAFTMDVGHHRDGAECETSACQFDDTRTVAGIVTVGVNKGGMWFSGAAAPWLSEWDMAVFSSCQPSGHWRWESGAWSLRAVLSVPVPGYPTPLRASAVQQAEAEHEHIKLHAAVARSNMALEAAIVPSAETNQVDGLIINVNDHIDTDALATVVASKLEQRAEYERLAATVNKTKAELLREQVHGKGKR